ncbi:LytTR family DNA-binding domain-containing protein [Zobellia galactanivorans]|uniref:Two-component system-Response regulator n=1 Tax=Zobellia galactanivorans (strain DSM 12802 / CCUG 47099 / CIP 106680 / NCIMB 13871 / Dsij) TaxID=63186 RepID=G0L1D8_ZOBGA|nr:MULTISPECIES: LytTR family DNA-binding domain-containing protein [Zobellia]MBU3026932.1 LytTR family DNA-binding domain-containing protein [Zobellia galactanivorans]MDO6810196.1 LytTR family DNA-binding domain-containing protein [Zobellia galactanivorans]OWW23786.1 DNA-binding response regulator [Zobellia sp. OII3]CAZ94629.1 Two-component system-Response regulator [Zobellia galactanivorans]
MLRAIIIDDEKHCQDRLFSLLGAHGAIQVESMVSSFDEGVVAIKKHNPQVVFLDVQLHDRTGFELLQELPHVNFEVIFTTGYDTYALEAFKFSALDYLLKPIAEDDLHVALEKLREKISLQEISKKMEVLFYNLDNQKASNFRKIAVPTVDGLSMIAITDIVRCQSDVNYTHLFLKADRKLTVAKTLKYFEALLEKHHFYRTHQSHLVNLSCVDKYVKGKGGYALMNDGSHIEVAVRRKEDFLKKLMG